MKRTLSNPIFLLCVTLAATNQVLEKVFGVFIPVIHSYLDDLLCFPIVLTSGLAMYRYFKPNYKLSFSHIWPTVTIYSVYFEWYLPQNSTVYTADILDVLMYVLGSVLFDLSINRKVATDTGLAQNSPSL